MLKQYLQIRCLNQYIENIYNRTLCFADFGKQVFTGRYDDFEVLCHSNGSTDTFIVARFHMQGFVPSESYQTAEFKLSECMPDYAAKHAVIDMILKLRSFEEFMAALDALSKNIDEVFEQFKEEHKNSEKMAEAEIKYKNFPNHLDILLSF